MEKGRLLSMKREVIRKKRNMKGLVSPVDRKKMGE